MAKTYRTAKGKSVDIGALLSQNEDVRAVGNMNVNAKGDIIDSQNKKIESKNRQVRSQYRKQIGNQVTDDTVYSSIQSARNAHALNQTAPEQKITKTKNTAEPATEQVAAPDPVVEPAITELGDSSKAKGGLAAALAKAREIKQEPLKSARQLAKDQQGVNKI